jgi:predicted ester cyclase
MTTPAELVERARQRWNAGDLPGYLELYAEDLQFHGLEPDPMDKAAVAAFYGQFWSAMAAPGRPNPHLEFHQQLTDGDMFACRFVAAGEHRGDFMGVPATGRPCHVGGVTIMRFRGDQVVERWTTADFLGLMVQLGAIPASAPA